MQVQATAKFIRISPRKARLVVDVVRGLPVERAERMLQIMNKKAAEPVLKLVRSAAANAEHNNKLKKQDLIIEKITANEGFVMKRYRARAFGRAGMLRKKTTHLHVVLGLSAQAKKAQAEKAGKGKKPTQKKVEKVEQKTTPVKKQPTQKPAAKMTDKKNVTKK